MNKIKTEYYLLLFLLLHASVVYGTLHLLLKVETINPIHFTAIFLFSFLGLLSGTAMGSSRIEMCVALAINLIISVGIFVTSKWEYQTDPIKLSCLTGIILGLLYFSIFVFFEFIKANKKRE